MAERPEKVILGIVLLGTAILIGKKTYHYYKAPIQEPPISSPPTTYFESFKKNVKAIAGTSYWTTVAITSIFLNTL